MNDPLPRLFSWSSFWILSSFARSWAPISDPFQRRDIDRSDISGISGAPYLLYHISLLKVFEIFFNSFVTKALIFYWLCHELRFEVTIF